MNKRDDMPANWIENLVAGAAKQADEDPVARWRDQMKRLGMSEEKINALMIGDSNASED